MKKFSVLFFVIACNVLSAQNIASEKKAVETVVNQFKESIIRKDSSAFYSLFHTEPVSWMGVNRTKTQLKLMKSDPKNSKNYFRDTYQSFFSYILKKEEKKELFENVHIENDDVIGSVTFDYSFWIDNHMKNYGKEFWHLIKTDGKWKIISVVFSYDLAEFYSESN
ncbi:nuclear transport factor 2 family protein [Flavobacterium sp. B17]|uniref:nuclear transport factor 2 family protein n=1 Tax=Flavobacterium sp. B17 TaxID=95618 RepID=UPI0005B28D65|nr:nuclear transport factor 2 family protein [Flavobacterium sp. B17]